MDNTNNDNSHDFDFDTCMTTGQIGMMKGILPFIEMPLQKYLAIYIKVLELQYVISYFRSHQDGIPTCSCETDKSPLSLLQNVRKYSSSKEGEMIDQMLQMMKAFEMYQNYSEMLKPFMDTFQMQGDDAPCENGQDDDNHEHPKSQVGGDNMISKLQGMLTPEQQAMFETFKDM
ncbi:MAG TPA: hypothetical protein VJZ01_10395 [Lachnospiraceae bacterium]|nr:hypothetical protein [Lachnospiraceae bacterium]